MSKVILGGFAAAALILLLSRPELPERKMNSGLPPQITLDLENATAAHQGAQLRYTEQEVNAYLADALRSKQAALDKPLLHFECVVVKMDEGLCQITAERSLFGYPLYTTGVFEVSTANDNIIASNRGGSVGRMQIHPMIMKYGDAAFADLWQALEGERTLVAKVAEIAFHPHSVVLTAATHQNRVGQRLTSLTHSPNTQQLLPIGRYDSPIVASRSPSITPSTGRRWERS